MIAFLLIVSVVLPPMVWLYGLLNLDPEANEMTSGECISTYLHNMFRSWRFWVWAVWVTILTTIFSGLGSKILGMLT